MNNNSNIFRMEIWEADFKGGYKSVICGKHPCIILSNFKTNVRSYGTVNVVPLTSNLVKYLNVHIDLKGYELKEDSKALCNQILTIDKSCLHFKIGKIDDIFTQLEIERAVESQLSLSGKMLSANNVDQLEEFFIGNVKTINSTAVYGKLKNDICLYANLNKIEECAIACTTLIELVLNSKIENKSEYLWYGYYHRAWTCLKLEHYDMAINDARQSLRFTGDLKKGLNNRYSYSMWMLSSAYENVNLNKSVELYTNLLKYYKNMGKTNLQIDILYNIARCKKNTNRMKTLIKIIKKMDFVETETNKTKDTILKQMYSDLTNAIS